MQFLFLALLPLAAFIILIVLIAKSSGHSIRIGALEREIKKVHELEERVTVLREYIDALKKDAGGQKSATPPRKTQEEIGSPAGKPGQPATLGSPPTRPIPVFAQKPAQPVAPSRTREEWEALIGGKLLNRIGALALIIGIGFFLKYAFDNNWISELTRILIGAVIGILCLIAGYRTDKRGYKIFAQGMVGAGIAILYLSVYAAFNFYHLMPQWMAFVFMAIVTIVAFLNGLFYNSLAEGILGWAGGFLTPIMLSTGHANEIGLFTYVVLLDVGLIAMVVKRNQWAILEPLAFVGTWLMYVTWYEQYYADGDLWMTVAFVAAFWVLFLVPDILRSRTAGPVDRLKVLVPGLNAAFSFLALYSLIDKDNHAWMGLVTLLMGGVYFTVFLLQHRRGNLRDEARIQYTLTAAALLVIATAIQFKDFDTVIFWSIEAAALAWCAKEWKAQYIQMAVLGLFGLAVVKLLFITDNGLMYSPIRDFTLLLNHRALAFAILAGWLGFGAFITDRTASARDRQISNALHGFCCLILFLLVTAETNDFFRFKMLDQPGEIQSRLSFFRLMTYAVVWITLSLPLVWSGLKRQLMPLFVAGLLCALLAVVFGAVRGVAFDPINYFAPVLNIRVISLLLVTTGLFLVAQFIQKSRNAVKDLSNLLSYVQVGIVLVIFVLLTGETRDFFQKDIASLASQIGIISTDINRLQNLQQMFLSGIWLFYSGVLMGVGVWRKYRGMRFVAIALFGITILKIFIYDLSFLETFYRFISFGALGLILLGVSYVYTKYKDVIAG